ncbi:MAG: YhgE/Pip domain-containing protein [Betaproteobacteria bacterium]|nr:YhgE/Pip domain-containing protein [Betaproteobacteria bacterium]
MRCPRWWNCWAKTPTRRPPWTPAANSGARMTFLRDALVIFRLEATLFTRFPKLKASAIGVMLIPALYALIYLASVQDPGAHTGTLKAAIVNLDGGLDYRGQAVNIGESVVVSLKGKQSFGFVDYPNEEDAKRDVRQGQLAFALIIPKDFSANAVPGNTVAGGRLVMYISEGNNYNGASLAKRFASELGHQVNINLNEKRWSLVLTTAAGSADKLVQLRQGVQALKEGAHRLSEGLGKASAGSQTVTTGANSFNSAVTQLGDGMKQLGAGLHTMDQQRPSAQDLVALKAASAELGKGHAALAQGLQDLQTGSQKLADGSNRMREETKNIPLFGGKVSEGAGQLSDGATQLTVGLQTARSGQAQLAEGTQKFGAGVTRLADGMTAMSNGIHLAATKVPTDAKLDELILGGNSLVGGTQSLNDGLIKLKAGSQELSTGLDLLNKSLPADIQTLEGSARGLADSVEPALEIVAPVSNNGAGFAPNFIATSLWMGAVMTAFLFHLRRLPEQAAKASPAALILGKLGIPSCIVIIQGLVIMLMTLVVLKLHIYNLGAYLFTLALTSMTFLAIIVALTRAFGDAGKAVALILLILQLSSAGGVMPVELSGGVYQILSPWLPFTWVVKALRACMFGAFDQGWLSAWGPIAVIGCLALLSACFVGKWKFVSAEEHRPAMDI